jgi:hypothetical protein
MPLSWGKLLAFIQCLNSPAFSGGTAITAICGLAKWSARWATTSIMWRF